MNDEPTPTRPPQVRVRQKHRRRSDKLFHAAFWLVLGALAFAVIVGIATTLLAGKSASEAANSAESTRVAAATAQATAAQARATTRSLGIVVREFKKAQAMQDVRSCRRGQRIAAELHASAPVVNGRKLLRLRELRLPIRNCDDISRGQNASRLPRSQQRRFVRFYLGHRGRIPAIDHDNRVIWKYAEPTQPPAPVAPDEGR